jgi:hypothetical protein
MALRLMAFAGAHAFRSAFSNPSISKRVLFLSNTALRDRRRVDVEEQ